MTKLKQTKPRQADCYSHPPRLMAAHAARRRTSIAMLVTLSALYAYPSGFVAAAGTFQPSAFGAGPGCTDLGRRLARHRVEATAVCFDRQLVSPHDGSSHESTAETAETERAVTRKTVPGGTSLYCRESSTDSRARARIDPASGTRLAPTHPPIPYIHRPPRLELDEDVRLHPGARSRPSRSAVPGRMFEENDAVLAGATPHLPSRRPRHVWGGVVAATAATVRPTVGGAVHQPGLRRLRLAR